MASGTREPPARTNRRLIGRILFSVAPTAVPGGGAVLVWLAVDVIVSFLACAWPAARATRIPTVAALDYE